VQSIFSAGIINVNQDRIILAKYWWMYAICAIVITVFVILVWVWFMRMKGRKILVTETEVDVEKSTQMTS
jgi:membrane protein YdbS with pleckstrin-like domain